MSDSFLTVLFSGWESLQTLERAAVLYWASLFFFGLSLRLVSRSCSPNFDSVRKELMALYYRRVDRVEKALMENWYNPPPLEEKHAFSGWVDLLADARLKIGGQEFCAFGEPFEITTKDPRNLVRAAVSSKGQGTLFISSHGFFYSATWNGEAWCVLPIDPQQSLQPS